MLGELDMLPSVFTPKRAVVAFRMPVTFQMPLKALAPTKVRLSSAPLESVFTAGIAPDVIPLVVHELLDG